MKTAVFNQKKADDRAEKAKQVFFAHVKAHRPCADAWFQPGRSVQKRPDKERLCWTAKVKYVRWWELEDEASS